MGLLETVKRFLYSLLVRSHILYYALPVVLPFLLLLYNPWRQHNDAFVDKKGRKILTTKVNGRYYPPIGERRVKTFSGIAIRDTDVLLCGYPKTGCHWTHEILTMLVTGKPKLSRYGKGLEGMLDVLPDCILDSLVSPRVLNTHYLFEQLPEQVKEKKTKIVFTVRNPKDTVVSYYNHMKNNPMDAYKGDFDDFFELFMAGKVHYGNYLDCLLAWDKHIKNPTTNEILMVKFEELKAKPVEEIKRIAHFLEIDITDEFAEEIHRASSFQNMKTKSFRLVRMIFRKGVVGDWKNWLTEEQSSAIDKAWQERMLGCAYQPKLA